MVTNYVRIRLPLESALPWFSEWIALPANGPPSAVPSGHVVDLACENGEWRSQVAVYIYASDGWTVFEDQTGYLTDVSPERWQAFGGSADVVFAGYDDTVAYGQLIVVRDGRVVREFLDDEQDPGQNVNHGRLDFEARSPIKDWTDVAYFVDGDDLVSFPDNGLLWMFG